MTPERDSLVRAVLFLAARSNRASNACASCDESMRPDVVGGEEGPECARSLGRLAMRTVGGYVPAMLSRCPPPTRPAGFIEPCLPTLVHSVPDGPQPRPDEYGRGVRVDRLWGYAR
jgi:hypothetical protein